MTEEGTRAQASRRMEMLELLLDVLCPQFSRHRLIRELLERIRQPC
jgi:hypothetical protein